MSDPNNGLVVPKAERKPLRIRAAALFSPSGPVTQQDLFAGRVQQMQDLISAHSEAGRHAVVYGERGVGKTSLAATMVEILTPHAIAVRINCDSSDDFASTWRKVFDEVDLIHQTAGVGFTPAVQQHINTAASMLPEDDVTPNDVRKALVVLTQTKRVVVFLDEFDRLDSSRVGAAFADTVKTLSDQLVPATLVMVGVADSVEDLIAEHRSTERALAQIHMPRMSTRELSEIVNRVKAIGMEADREARQEITHLSQGLPHYTHGLSQSAAVAAVDRGSRLITPADVQAGVRIMIKRQAQESVTSAYHRATFSTRETLYKEVLLACALAPADDLGYFASSDVRIPLSKIMGRRYEIPAFSQHLKELSEVGGARGHVLQRAGTSRKFRFRFINPLLQPYIVLRGIDDGLISMTQARELAEKDG
jgi:Cdc6-like AAA superfamily ATPase